MKPSMTVALTAATRMTGLAGGAQAHARDSKHFGGSAERHVNFSAGSALTAPQNGDNACGGGANTRTPVRDGKERHTSADIT
jgi:hypothetical protein